MGRAHRLTIIGTSGLLVVMSGCAAPEEPTVLVLRATGVDVDEAEVTYTIDGEETTRTVSLPWQVEVEVDGAIDIDLSVANPTDVGAVACEIGPGPGFPSEEGEVSAACSVTGRADGDTMQIESVEDAIDREPGSSTGAVASGDGGSVDVSAASVETGPVKVSLEVHDDDGVVVGAPVVGGRYSLVVVAAGIDREVSVGYSSELDDGETVRSNDGGERFELDEVTSGVLVLGVTSWEVVTETRHVWTVSGTVFAADDSFDAPFELAYEFVPAPFVPSAPTEFESADGSLSALVPGTWQVEDTIDEWTTFEEMAPIGDPGPYDPESMEVLAVFGHATSDSSLTVFRLLRPRAAPRPEELADQLIPVLAGIGLVDITTEAVELDGHPGARIVGRGPGGRFTYDVVPVEREYFVVRAVIADDDASVDDAVAMHASLALDESRFQPLTHRLGCRATHNPGGVAPLSLEMVVPADWTNTPDETTSVICGAPTGGGSAQALSRRSSADLDAAVGAALTYFGLAIGDVTVTQTMVDQLPAALVALPGETAIWLVVHGEEIDTLLVIDAGDATLNETIAASVRLVE